MTNIFWGQVPNLTMISGRFHNFVFCLGLAAFMVLQASTVMAGDKIKALTEENVKAFIENTTDVTTSNSNDLSPDKVAEYLDKHVEDKARFKSVMKYHIPGMPPQEAELKLDKEGFMTSVNDGAEQIEGYETLIEIKQIKLASNGKKAFVKTSNTEYATMPVPTETGDTQEVPIEGVSECTQILSLNSGVIQMYSANCVTDIHFLEY